MPPSVELLLSEAAKLGLKASVREDRIIISTPDSLLITDKGLEIRVIPNKKYRLIYNGEVQDFDDPRTLLVYAYNLASQKLFTKLYGEIRWIVRILESYSPNEKIIHYYHDILSLEGDPRLLILAASVAPRDDFIVRGLERLKEEKFIINIIRRRINSLKHLRHSRFGLAVASMLNNTEAWKLLASTYHAVLTIKPLKIITSRNPFLYLLSSEASWLTGACLEAKGIPEIVKYLSIPLRWSCRTGEFALSFMRSKCTYPCFYPLPLRNHIRVPLKGFIVYYSREIPLSIVEGVEVEAKMAIVENLAGPHDSFNWAINNLHKPLPSSGLKDLL